MKPLVIYHADCTDGFGAAFAAWLKLGDDADYLPMAYGQVTNANDILCVKGRDVYILDFSFERGIMETLMILADRVVWLDHHKTAFEMWCEKERNRWEEGTGCLTDDQRHYILLDNVKSGALLAWEYFHPDVEVPMLIQHIDDRDRWQFKMPGSKEVHAALQSYKPWSFVDWKARFIADGSTQYDHMFVNGVMYPRLMDEGRAILRAQDQHVASMAKQARACEISFRKEAPRIEKVWCAGLARNATLHVSELGHVLATQSGTYALIWYVAQDNKVKCSLRSNGAYDVSAIAHAFGGGGHKNAAGFETDIDTLMGWLK